MCTFSKENNCFIKGMNDRIPQSLWMIIKINVDFFNNLKYPKKSSLNLKSVSLELVKSLAKTESLKEGLLRASKNRFFLSLKGVSYLSFLAN